MHRLIAKFIVMRIVCRVMNAFAKGVCDVLIYHCAEYKWHGYLGQH